MPYVPVGGAGEKEREIPIRDRVSYPYKRTRKIWCYISLDLHHGKEDDAAGFQSILH
jgi:hypothetical protein